MAALSVERVDGVIAMCEFWPYVTIPLALTIFKVRLWLVRVLIIVVLMVELLIMFVWEEVADL